MHPSRTSDYFTVDSAASDLAASIWRMPLAKPLLTKQKTTQYEKDTTTLLEKSTKSIMTPQHIEMQEKAHCRHNKLQ